MKLLNIKQKLIDSIFNLSTKIMSKTLPHISQDQFVTIDLDKNIDYSKINDAVWIDFEDLDLP